MIPRNVPKKPILFSMVRHSYCVSWVLKGVATPIGPSGHDLPPGAKPTLQNVPDKRNWYPFGSRIKFETAEFLFTENQMLQSQVDKLMQLWSASVLQHDDWAPFADHKDLHWVIDAIPHGDIPLKSIQVQFSGDIPNPSPHWMTKSYDIWFRDPNVVVETLLSNPDFDKHFDYVPYCEFKPTGERWWENFMSGNWAWCHAVSFIGWVG